MREVQDALIVGVGMDRGHDPFLDAKVIVNHLGHGSQAVRGARGIGDDQICGFESFMIHSHHDGGIDGILGRSCEHNLLCPGFEVFGSLFFAGEDTSGFHHDIHSQICPGQVFRISLGKDADLFAIYHQAVFRVRNFPGIDLVDTVILEQKCQSLGIREVVYGNDADLGITLQEAAQHQASNPAETVDSYFGHLNSFYNNILLFALPVTWQKPMMVFCITSSPLASHLRGSNLLLFGI